MNSCKGIALLLVLILTFSLFSCNNSSHKGNQSGHQGQITPEDDEEGLEEETELTYVYSIVTKVLHLPDCYHIDRMNDEYVTQHSGDITLLLQNGYTVCRDCLVPDDLEKEEEEEEDDTNKVAPEDATFVINKSSKIVHLLDCYHVEKMVEKNRQYTDLMLDELIADEHRPCGVCMPEEAKEYEKTHPKEK
ncbi:MAG: hypothetical protein J6V80_01880 [Clostridia bacterium]|nr:hypothetical protein [Clostridia bacterium]